MLLGHQVQRSATSTHDLVVMTCTFLHAAPMLCTLTTVHVGVVVSVGGFSHCWKKLSSWTTHSFKIVPRLDMSSAFAICSCSQGNMCIACQLHAVNAMQICDHLRQIYVSLSVQHPVWYIIIVLCADVCRFTTGLSLLASA